MTDRFTIDGHEPRTLHEYAVCLDCAEEELAKVRLDLQEWRHRAEKFARRLVERGEVVNPPPSEGNP